MPSFNRFGGRRSRESRSAKTLPTTQRQRARPAPRFIPSGRNFKITGTTVDASGVALGACAVELFRTGDNSLAATTVSDGAGAFQFVLADNAGLFYAVAYKSGATDVAGTTTNTLVAVEL